VTEPERSVYEELLAVAVFAPIGALLKLTEVLPELVTKGRARLSAPLATSNAIGHLAIATARRRIDGLARDFVAMRGQSPSKGANAASEESTTAAPDLAETRPETPLHLVGADFIAEDLPILSYDSLAASQVVDRLSGLDADELEAVRRYEVAHRGRRTILTRIAQLEER